MAINHSKLTFLLLILLLGLSISKIIDDEPPKPAASSPSPVPGSKNETSKIQPKDIITHLAVIFFGLFAALGGNSLIMPVLIVFYRMLPHIAMAYSAVFVMASSVARLTAVLMREVGNRLDYDVMLMAVVSSTPGLLIGARLNAVTQEMLLWILVNLVLCGVLFVTLWKLNKQRGEADGPKRITTESELPVQAKHILKGFEGDEEDLAELFDSFRPAVTAKTVSRNLEVYGDDDRPISDSKAARPDEYSLTGVHVAFVAVSLIVNPLWYKLKGTQIIASSLNLKPCSQTPWGLWLGYSLFMITLIIGVCLWIVHRREKEFKKFKGSEYIPRVRMTLQSTTFISSSAFLVGILAGLNPGFTLGGVFLFVKIFGGFNSAMMEQTSLLIASLMSFSLSVMYFMKGLLDPLSCVFGALLICGLALAARFYFYDDFLSSKDLWLFLVLFAVLVAASIPLNLLEMSTYFSGLAKAGKLWKWRDDCQLGPPTY